MGSRTWSFGVTWRYRSRDHSATGGRLPMGGPMWPCGYLALLWRRQHLKTCILKTAKNTKKWYCPITDTIKLLYLNFIATNFRCHRNESVSVVRTTLKVYGKRQNLTLSQPKTQKPIVTKFEWCDYVVDVYHQKIRWGVLAPHIGETYTPSV